MNLPRLDQGAGGWEHIRGGHSLKTGEPRRSFYAPDYGAAAAPRGKLGEPKQPRVRHRCGSAGPFVSTEPLRRLLAPIVEELGPATVSALAGIHPRSLYRVLHQQRTCTVQMADVLICDVLDDPSLWYTTDGLDLRDQLGRPVAARP